jgi:hypothetical protein
MNKEQVKHIKKFENIIHGIDLVFFLSVYGIVCISLWIHRGTQHTT